MGIKVMRWPLRPASTSKKYQVNIVLHRLEGLEVGERVDETRLIVNVKWKGPKNTLGSRFGTKTGRTSPVLLGCCGAVEWEEDFDNICALSVTREGLFQSWPVSFVVWKPLSSAPRAKPFIVGSASVDLGEVVGNATEGGSFKKLPIVCNIGGSDVEAILSISFNFIELRTMFEGFESVHRLVAPAIACMGEPSWDSDDQKPNIMAMRKKGRSLKGLTLKASKKAPLEVELTDDGKLSPPRSEGKSSSSDGSLHDSENPFDSDSLEDSDVDGYLEAGDEVMLQKSFSYGTLAGANLVAEEVIPFHRDGNVDPDSEDIMTVHSRVSSAAFPKTATEEPRPTQTDSTSSSPLSVREHAVLEEEEVEFQVSAIKREPLLNKAYGEEGGDEIDWDRRQSNVVSAEEKFLLLNYHSGETLSTTSSNAAEALDFGDELFTVGSWEMKDLVSRDGLIKVSANVFFASFDQRSESAAGESACTALVAVIADWLHTHPGLMPSKAEFDMLIRDGSAEWRKLCEVDTYKDRFPDRHFDLETVLEAGVRPLTVSADRSFVGFFQPERVEELGEAFDFLKHAMSFDAIWDEIERCGPAVYIVSWNDHFFVLRVEEHCCYIIDTLGERLYEGCNQAYILHFDETTTLSNVPSKPAKDTKVLVAPAGSEGAVSNEKSEKIKQPDADTGAAETASEGSGTDISVAEKVYGGRVACRQFVKGFFAAIQLREVELEAKKSAAGKSTQTSIYQKLQIEFNYAKSVESFPRSNTFGIAF